MGHQAGLSQTSQSLHWQPRTTPSPPIQRHEGTCKIIAPKLLHLAFSMCFLRIIFALLSKHTRMFLDVFSTISLPDYADTH